MLTQTQAQLHLYRGPFPGLAVCASDSRCVAAAICCAGCQSFIITQSPNLVEQCCDMRVTWRERQGKLSENLHRKHDELGCWKFLLMCDWFAVCAGVGVCESAECLRCISTGVKL